MSGEEGGVKVIKDFNVDSIDDSSTQPSSQSFLSRVQSTPISFPVPFFMSLLVESREISTRLGEHFASLEGAPNFDFVMNFVIFNILSSFGETMGNHQKTT